MNDVRTQWGVRFGFSDNVEEVPSKNYAKAIVDGDPYHRTLMERQVTSWKVASE